MIVVGDLVTDIVVTLTADIRPGTDTPAVITQTDGGQGANTAAWLAHAGATVTLVAAVGDDPAGADRIAELEAAGVRSAVRTHPGARTGTVVVLSTTTDRTLITDSAACHLLAAPDVIAAIAATPAARHLHLSGYCLLNEGSRAAGRAALFAASGLTTSVDAASAGPLRSVGPGVFLDWVRGTDLLLCNTDEALELAGPGTPLAQAKRLTEVVPNVVVKQGGDGALWATADGHSWSVPATHVPAADPTGAGDAFAAGLLHAWRNQGADPGAALAAGAALGAAAVSQIGARPPS